MKCEEEETDVVLLMVGPSEVSGRAVNIVPQSMSKQSWYGYNHFIAESENKIHQIETMVAGIPALKTC